MVARQGLYLISTSYFDHQEEHLVISRENKYMKRY